MDIKEIEEFKMPTNHDLNWIDAKQLVNLSKEQDMFDAIYLAYKYGYLVGKNITNQ